MENIIITTGGILLIGFIIWWFFGKRTASQATATAGDNGKQEVTVTVSGGYTPNVAVFKQGSPAEIVFDRKDSSNCFNEVVFPDFGVNETLPVGKPHSIAIDTSKPGEYQYSCGMNMFHGKVIIK